jgi:hypothetical protein
MRISIRTRNIFTNPISISQNPLYWLSLLLNQMSHYNGIHEVLVNKKTLVKLGLILILSAVVL